MTRVTQREIERAIRAAKNMGVAIGEIRIAAGGGTVAIIAMGADAPQSEAELETELVKWRAANGNG